MTKTICFTLKCSMYFLCLCSTIQEELLYLNFIYEYTFKSPEMFAPARTPVAAGKKMAKTEKKLCSFVKCGTKFVENVSSKREKKNFTFSSRK